MRFFERFPRINSNFAILLNNEVSVNLMKLGNFKLSMFVSGLNGACLVHHLLIAL